MKRWPVLLLLLLAAVATADVVVMRADPWYPVNADPDSERPGYVVEIARFALARAGHELDYALLPWERSVDGVRRGSIDCLPGAQRIGLPDLLFSSESFGVDRMAFFARHDAPAWVFRSLPDLQTKVVAVISGYSYSETMNAFITSTPGSANLQITKGEKALERNIKMLLAGRVDLVLESIPAFEHKVREMGVAKLVMQAAPLPESPDIYVACSPAKASSAAYLRALDEGLRELRRSGRLQPILDKYGLRDWQLRSGAD